MTAPTLAREWWVSMLVQFALRLVHFALGVWIFPDAGRKWVKANMIACPAGTLQGRAFSAAPSTACAGTQFVARSIRPPQDHGDCARQRCVVLATLTPQPYPGRRPL
jgi:hypothetical protein